MPCRRPGSSSRERESPGIISCRVGILYGVRALTNRYAAAAVGIGAALVLALTQAGGKGGLALWPLFGTTNQLVAGATLLIVTIWLKQLGRSYVYTLIPMLFVGTATFFAMIGEVRSNLLAGSWTLAAIGSTILILDVWVLLEGFRALSRSAPVRVDVPRSLE